MNGGTTYSKGDVVIIHFPYSNLVQAKKRPMVVLAEYKQDLIGCAITSNPQSEGILLEQFEEGSLPLKSRIKYWQIATFLKGVVIKKVARIGKTPEKELITKICALLTS